MNMQLIMQNKIFSYWKLAQRIKNKPDEKAKAIEYINEIAANYNLATIEKFKVLLEHTIVKLYKDIDFEVPPSLTNLGEFVKENNVVFVPNHQSHADYLVLSYILFKNFGFIPLIAGGINLNVFPIGALFRKSGCFFIRRSFNNNILYKITLEAYLFYLFTEGHSIEFFYEGGRSRTGKLQSPKYGLFQMLLEAHDSIVSNQNELDPKLFANFKERPLYFIPVSIVHEVVPEHKSLIREMCGEKKQKESFGQLFKLYKFVTKRFGTVHLRLNDPILSPKIDEQKLDLKQKTQQLAHKCYRMVGRGMKITPSSLLAVILLNGPTGPMTFEGLFDRATSFLSFCERFRIPLSPSLDSKFARRSLREALDFLLDDNKIKIINNPKLDQVFYVVPDESRIDLLYAKNAILHHFIVPFFINAAWIYIFNGTIKTANELKEFLVQQMNLLSHEFYLPAPKDLLVLSVEVIENATGKKIKELDDCFDFTSQEIYQVAVKVAPFANAFRYIYEGYYIAAMTLRYLNRDYFSRDRFLKAAREIFELERTHGRIIKYSESYTIPTIKNALSYFSSIRLIINEDNNFYVPNQKRVEDILAKYAKELTDTLILNLRSGDLFT
ncbi:MAG: 1-acyl-sn-glycerol-3-phosphate acyltransferase [Oligoflexia bacterium]|nr:1-acyl-sn-glycerol-3-phosphate acyltransferase [Oligoflexia bacterium]